MDCRISIAHKPRARLDIKLHDVILTKEQSVLAKIKCLFKEENMKPQHRTLGWKTDLYFHGNKLEDLVVYFNRYNRGKVKRMLSLYYDESMGEIETEIKKNIRSLMIIC